MSKRRSALVLSALLAAAPAVAGNVWNLTWEETGNGAANTQPSAAQWRYDTGGGGWGNNELENYTNRTQNVRYDGAGNLVIEARAESYGGNNYTSGRIQTAATFTQAYGRMEARIKLPYGQGIWPAFWMLGNNIGPSGWPACGEIDIMEMVGYAPNSYFGTLHGPGYSGGGGISAEKNIGSNISAGYHLFAVEWEPGIVRWTIDNEHWLTRTPGDIPAGTTWVYDHPFFLILNLAVGGNWPGAPNGTTVFPQQMLVDYVRVYSRDTSQRPYSGTPMPIAGTIEVENFDDGGPGVAYSDTTTYHPGGVNNFRFSEQPDLAPTTDAGGGYGLGWAVAGEWLEYTVNVASAGAYAFTARVASQGQGGAFHLQMDGADVAGSSMTIPDTGGWGNWQDLGPVTVNLPAGVHVLQLHLDTNGPVTGGTGNFNWLKFTSLTTPTRTFTPSPLPTFTRTATPPNTPTLTVTRSSTPSVTPFPSPTRTVTATATPSATPSATGSATPSATRTATRTATTSSTPSATTTATAPPATPTVSGSPTELPTAGPSATASPTSAPPTLTASPQPGSPTVTMVPPTSSPTAVPPTATRTALPATATPTALPATATPTPLSASASPTATPSATRSATASATPTATASATPSASSSVTVSATPTATIFYIPPASPVLTATTTINDIPPASPVATGTATPTRTAVSTSSATPSATPVSTGTATPTTQSTSVPTPNGGGCQLLPVINPQRGGQLSFAIYSEGIRSSVRLRCYSPSFNAVLEQDLGPLAPGWQRISLPALGLANGVYWARLSTDGKPLGKPARFLYLP